MYRLSHVADEGEVGDQQSLDGTGRSCERRSGLGRLSDATERKTGRREDEVGGQQRRTGAEGEKRDLRASVFFFHGVGWRERKAGSLGGEFVKRRKRRSLGNGGICSTPRERASA